MRKVFVRTVSAAVLLLSMSGLAVADTVWAVAPPFFLFRFDSATPNVIEHVVVVKGLQPGERLEAIDFRPRTGQLYGLGVIDGSVVDTVRTYVIDPRSGVATLVGSSIDLFNGNSYAVDFNPAVDRIRVANDADENLRINPNNGALAGDDTNLNPTGFQVIGAAYDRNFDNGFVGSGTRTTLFAIAKATSALQTIGGVNSTPSPNTGQLTTVGPLGVTLSALGEVGFDIPAGSTVGWASLRSAATGLTGLYTINLTTAQATLVGTIANGAIQVSGLAVVPRTTLVTAPAAGGGPHIRVFDGHSGAVQMEFFAYAPSFLGGVRVATGDVNLDGVPDIITGPGPSGTPHIKVINGLTGALLPGTIGQFFAFDPAFTGGVFVAAGDVNGDGNKDVIVTPDAGAGPQVRVISGATGSVLAEFFAYGTGFGGGARVATADFDRDGDAEIITAPGPSGGPHVRVFDGTGALFSSASLPNFPSNFFAYSPTFTGGVFVAAGDVNGDAVPDIITGPGAGGGPHVRAFSGVDGAVICEFFAYEAEFTGGVQVAVADVNKDGRYEIITSPGDGRPAEVRAFDGATGAFLSTFAPYSGFGGGAFVAGVRR
jgi:Domain of unknown function (DUF4394)/FG-GAP-like repeat